MPLDGVLLRQLEVQKARLDTVIVETPAKRLVDPLDVDPIFERWAKLYDQLVAADSEFGSVPKPWKPTLFDNKNAYDGRGGYVVENLKRLQKDMAEAVMIATTARGASGFSPTSERSHDENNDLPDEYDEVGETAMPDRRDVFVVYGRDDKRKDFFFDFLRRLQLNPIEFEEAIRLTGSGSPYTGDAVRTALDHAQVVMVLFTGDDLAHLRPELVRDNDGEAERNPAPQPRPNVILEAGMALALDRKRTIIVEVPPLRGISDLHGLNVVRFGKGESPERNNLANRLETAGCDLKRIGSDWLTLPFPSKPPGS